MNLGSRKYDFEKEVKMTFEKFKQELRSFLSFGNITASMLVVLLGSALPLA